MKRETVADHTVGALRAALAAFDDNDEVRVRTSMTVSRDGGLAKAVTVREVTDAIETPRALKRWENGPHPA